MAFKELQETVCIISMADIVGLQLANPKYQGKSQSFMLRFMGMDTSLPMEVAVCAHRSDFAPTSEPSPIYNCERFVGTLRTDDNWLAIQRRIRLGC
jgi:hypothetical protein